MVCQIDDGYETLFGEYESYTEGFPRAWRRWPVKSALWV
jgi:hypothetical protein